MADRGGPAPPPVMSVGNVEDLLLNTMLAPLPLRHYSTDNCRYGRLVYQTKWKGWKYGSVHRWNKTESRCVGGDHL